MPTLAIQARARFIIDPRRAPLRMVSAMMCRGRCAVASPGPSLACRWVGALNRMRLEHHNKFDPLTTGLGQARSFGDVGSTSGLPESGHGWTICEYTP